MARIMFGADFLEENTVLLSLCNANSPLVWDSTMLGAAQRVRRGEPGRPDHAVHPRRRDEPGHGGGRRDADARGGARRHGVRPARPAGRAGGARLVRVVALDAVRRTDVRDAGAGARPLRHGGARPPPRRAVPLRRGVHGIEGAGRPGGLRVGEHDAADDARRRQLRPARRGLARGRAHDGLREVRPRRRPVRDVARVREGRRPEQNGQALDALLSNEPGPALPRPRTHARQLRDGVLPLAGLGQLELRAVGGRGRARRRAAGDADLEAMLESYEAPPIDDAVDEELREWIERKKASFPDSDY